MRVASEFERFADRYPQYNHIQRLVADRLISQIESINHATYADIGCGEGAIYRSLVAKDIDIERFIAIDISPSMLSLHPNADYIDKIKGDFNSESLYRQLDRYSIDMVVSASSLQWSQDLEWSLEHLSHLAPKAAYAIFTDATFSDILRYLSVPSPIHSATSIIEALLRYYHIRSMRVESITMPFENNRDMLSYIKKSGVSGGRAMLSYRDIKRFIDSYDKRELEFQIIYFTGNSKTFYKPKSNILNINNSVLSF